ncbi:hypothetical protein [Xanthobacter autotrophicus]|uniref:hypothetical protein n=1 Tax=Xanthobacter autotrophicus TaxID=280 RepID=UPI0024A76F36|nr:hypothetical protein [Xanthobacter autotrophicus]MDI4655836.1 hypothetical protein [Xanthobacter autotrophicus]
MIEVRQSAGGDPLKFEVVVRDTAGETRHVVTMAPATYQELTAGRCTPAKCVEATFRFLLDREPKEQILARFDMAVVPHYYPDFVAKLPNYLAPS